VSLPDRSLLGDAEVVVHVDPSDGATAVWAAAALVSMSARVVGHVRVPALPLRRPNPWDVRTLPAVMGISRMGRSSRHRIDRRITVGIGRHSPAADVYFGGDDWTASVSRTAPVPVGQTPFGGMGLQAAAALAFGEVLKLLCGPLGMRNVPLGDDDDQLTWNLLDGRLAPPPLHEAFRPVRAPKVLLLGAGSIGSSAAAVLSLSRLVGVIDIVDPDRFEPRHNAERCPGVPVGETGPKADWAARVLGDVGWVATAHQETVAAWSANRLAPGFLGLALVTVDNVDARRDAAEVLAETTVSAGVAGTALHVHRHLALDDLACPYCEFVDAGCWRERGQLYARFGLTASRLQELLEGDRLSVEDVATAIWTGAVDASAVERLVGGRLVDLLPATERTTEVAAPHVSWLAGTLLAAEVVKEAVGVAGIDRRVEVDLSGIPLGGWRRPARNGSGRCPCTNPARRQLARSLYER
jgi:hypothetical protein